MSNLTAKRIARLKEPGRYRDKTIPGLYFQISTEGGRSFVFRYERNGRERMMGLGPTHTISLATARERARFARQQLLDGIDPLDARNGEKQAKAAEAARSKTFRECADDYLNANRANWRSAKHAAQWDSTLKKYAFPIIGALPVAEIDTAILIKVLEQETGGGPLWTTKQETASRLRGRMETILSWATVRGLRSGDNPARWRGHLKEALARTNGHKHHPSLPFAELPAFMAELKAREGIASRALEFLILTTTRTNEVIAARWDEIDHREKVWTIPGSRMKSGREHRVPLPHQALALLKKLPRESEFVFIGGRAGHHLSNMAMLQVMKVLRPTYVPHGFRATFRTWAAERGLPRDIAEAALAHVTKDKTEAAYQRGDLLERRREMMAAWATFCFASGEGATVTPLKRRTKRATESPVFPAKSRGSTFSAG